MLKPHLRTEADRRLTPRPQGTQAPLAGLFSWAFALQRFARKPDLVEATLTRVARR